MQVSQVSPIGSTSSPPVRVSAPAGRLDIKGGYKKVTFWTKLGVKFVKLAKHVSSAFKSFLSKGTVRGFKATGIISGILVPLDAANFVESVKDGIAAKKSVDKAEDSLCAIASTGSVISGVASTITGAMVIEGIRKGVEVSAPVWAQALLVVGMVLNVAGAIANGIGLHRTYKLNKRLKKNGDVLDNLQLLCEKSDRSLKKKFCVGDVKGLKDKLEKCRERILQGEENSVKEARALIDHLRGRAKRNMISKVLKIAIYTISSIGLLIALFSPLAPLGYAFLAITTITAIALAIKERRDGKKPIYDPLKEAANL